MESIETIVMKSRRQRIGHVNRKKVKTDRMTYQVQIEWTHTGRWRRNVRKTLGKTRLEVSDARNAISSTLPKTHRMHSPYV